MANFHLEIVTLDGQKYAGEVEQLMLRSITGDIAILAHHTNYCTAVGMGTAKVHFPDGTVREAACVGGMLSVMDGICRLLPTTFEWSDEIDLVRAEEAKRRAEELLKEKLSEEARIQARARLYRALIRIQTAGQPKLKL
ncbi:ATP synthase F1, epsilon subunit [Stomatobaculum longum]|uniref:ATP synthase epsilon chain n=1 Tax=Stomatobaculum longum TaxID=796942 RepID=A0AA37DH32_9FIRM|nr:ATP synthase F1 subunit epsilon [Stomatobaculum longum]EHO17958.1 ATP synthase F1, epsilon subunit [Stomatobaculum longum]